jgi:diacylglycerol kinase (ATP)
METVFIVNPEAGSSEEFIELLSAATERDDLRPKTSRHPGHARELTREALDEGVDRLVVVGGDGTINEVVNGLGDERIDEEVTDVEIRPNALRVLVPPPDGLNND